LCQNEKAWDSNIINSIFPPYVANSILAVPLFDDVVEDQLVWNDDMYGNYTVKSGYNLLLQTPIEAVTRQGNEDWKGLWKIHAPPKTKHLLWRICKGCLPTRTRLRERHVQCPSICPLCELEEEDDWHVLYGCESSKAAWQAAGLNSTVVSYFQQAQSAKDFIMQLCRHSSGSDAGKAATVIWFLWKNRNSWVWNKETEHGQLLGCKALNFWHEWQAVQCIYTSNVQQVQQRQSSWQPPPRGKYKCNIDVGVHADARKTSAGWCVRDHRGFFVLGGSSWIDGSCSPHEGEALALLGAMKELQQRGFHNVIFEIDAQVLVGAIKRQNIGVSEFSSIVSKIKCFLSLYSGFEVKPIRRQANRIAHTIARAALSWSRRHVFDLIPLCIHNLLSNEMI
jgi:ribonuclease HI